MEIQKTEIAEIKEALELAESCIAGLLSSLGWTKAGIQEDRVIVHLNKTVAKINSLMEKAK